MTSTARLAKRYDTLTAGERLSALAHAAERGDAVESARLMQTAPRLTLTVPHTFPRAEAFHATAGWFRAKLLDLAGTYLHLRGVTLFSSGFERFAPACRLFGWLVGIHRSGWSMFCDSEGLPAGYFDEHLPGDMVFHFTDAALADRAYLPPLTDDEARELVGPNVMTAAAVADGLHAAFDLHRQSMGE